MKLRDLLNGPSEPIPPYPFDALGTYNAERARGIVHTQEWQDLMANEQRRFNNKEPSRFFEEQLERGMFAHVYVEDME